MLETLGLVGIRNSVGRDGEKIAVGSLLLLAAEKSILEAGASSLAIHYQCRPYVDELKNGSLLGVPADMNALHK